MTKTARHMALNFSAGCGDHKRVVPLGQATLEEKRFDNGGKLCNTCYMSQRRPSEPFTHALKHAIAESGMSFKAIERESGVKRQSLMRFMRGEQSLRLDMADKLAVHFGIEIRPPKRRKR